MFTRIFLCLVLIPILAVFLADCGGEDLNSSGDDANPPFDQLDDTIAGDDAANDDIDDDLSDDDSIDNADDDTSDDAVDDSLASDDTTGDDATDDDDLDDDSMDDDADDDVDDDIDDDMDDDADDDLDDDAADDDTGDDDVEVRDIVEGDNAEEDPSDDTADDDSVSMVDADIELAVGGGYGLNSLAVDGQGVRYLFYTRSRDIHYLKSTDGQTWIDHFYARNGASPLAAAGSDGYVRFVYTRQTPGTVTIRYADNTQGTWQSEAVESLDHDVWTMNLAVDANNHTHLVYRDETLHQWIYANNIMGTWQTELLPVQPAWSGISIAADSEGHLHALCGVQDGDQLVYATNRTGDWTTEIVAQPAYGAWSLALDNEGFVHVSYSAHWYLMYATNRSGSWVSRELDEMNTGYDCGSGDDNRIVVTPSGSVYVMYTDHWYNIEPWDFHGWLMSVDFPIDTQDDHYTDIAYDDSWVGFHLAVSPDHQIHYVYSPGSVANSFDYTGGGVETLVRYNLRYETSPDESSYAADNAGTNHFAYRNGYSLYYATDSGGSWGWRLLDEGYHHFITETVWEERETGIANDIRAWSNEVHASYGSYYTYSDFGYANSYVDLNLGWIDAEDFGASSVAHEDEIESRPDPPRSSLAVSTVGDVAVSYNFSSGLGLYVRSDNTELVDPDGYYQSALAFDGDGFLHTAYYTHPSGMSYSTNRSGTWEITQISAEVQPQAYFISLALDGDLNTHVIYNDQDTCHLGYATDASGDWVLSCLSVTGEAYNHAIAADVSGSLHLAYADPASGTVRYATNSGGTWRCFDVDDIQADYINLALDEASGKIRLGYSDASALWLATFPIPAL